MSSVLAGTRLTIAKLLQREGTATVESLASQLELAAATVRRHLDILQRDGLVGFNEVRKGTGRPRHAFRLSEKGQEALPKAYDHLLSLLLREAASMERGALDQKDGAEIVHYLFQRMANSLAVSYSNGAGGSFEDRLSNLQKVMEDGGYSPEVQLQNGAAILFVHNCPYRSVANEVKEVCLFDQTFISTVLGAPVTRTDCIAQGSVACCYKLEAPEGTSG